MLLLVILLSGVCLTSAQALTDDDADSVSQDEILPQPIVQTAIENDIETELRRWFHKELLRFLFQKGLMANQFSNYKSIDNRGVEDRENNDQDMPAFGQVLHGVPSFVKKSNIYGMNRPMGLRHTRLADFGSMLLPNKNSDTSRSTVIRYG